MSNPLFASTKSALVFAGITIFGALVMVGPGGGILGQAKERFGRPSEPAPQEAPVSEQPKPAVTEPLDPEAGWGGTGGDAVFGDYGREEPPPSEVVPPEDSSAPPAPVPAYAPPARRTASLPAATGGPVKADSLGTLVPRNDGSAAAASSRNTDIEPE